MVPVLGKKAPIGLLILASERERKLTAEELDFLGNLWSPVGNRGRKLPSARASVAFAAAVEEHI